MIGANLPVDITPLQQRTDLAIVSELHARPCCRTDCRVPRRARTHVLYFGPPRPARYTAPRGSGRTARGEGRGDEPVVLAHLAAARHADKALGRPAAVQRDVDRPGPGDGAGVAVPQRLRPRAVDRHGSDLNP